MRTTGHVGSDTHFIFTFVVVVTEKSSILIISLVYFCTEEYFSVPMCTFGGKKLDHLVM